MAKDPKPIPVDIETDDPRQAILLIIGATYPASVTEGAMALLEIVCPMIVAETSSNEEARQQLHAMIEHWFQNPGTSAAAAEHFRAIRPKAH